MPRARSCGLAVWASNVGNGSPQSCPCRVCSGKEAWPSACVLVLGVLKESCMSEPTPSVRTAVRAIGALVDDNPHNRAVLKVQHTQTNRRRLESGHPAN